MRKPFGIMLCLVLALVLPGVAMAKQDVLVELFYSGAWHDVSSRVYTRDPVTINHGAGDEQTGVVPSDASLTFTNRDGEMNPENRKSSLFGLIGRNTPVRITVGTDVRFSGQVVSWKPRRAKGKLDATRGDAWVAVQAQGTIRRLGQGEQPVESAMYRAYSASSPTAWWPLEDASSATQAASAVNGVEPMVLSGNGLTKFAGFPGPPGAASAADTSQTGTSADVMQGFIPEVSATSWRVEFSMMYRTTDASYNVGMPGWSTRGEVELWYLDQNEAGTGLRLFYIDSTGIQTAGTAAGVENNDGLWHLYTIVGEQSGSDIAVEVFVDNVSVLSATVTSRVFGVPFEISGQAGIFSSDPTATGLSHIAVWTPASVVDTYPAFTGHSGETAGERFTRLCDEEGISSTIVGTEADTQPMGPQPAETFLKLLDEVARTDAGIIHDTRDELGLTFRTGRSLMNQ
jgi:hypothetical protein